MDLINSFFEFFYRYVVIVATLGPLSVFPILFFVKIVKPTLENKKKYSIIATKKYYDVDVYFKRYDLFNSKIFFNPFKTDTYSSVFKNTYEFYKADILVLESSILIFSKHNILGFKFNWFSFKINFDNNIPSTYDIFTVECLSMNSINKNLEIEFNDYNYKKSIIIGIKKVGLEIQEIIKQKTITKPVNLTSGSS